MKCLAYSNNRIALYYMKKNDDRCLHYLNLESQIYKEIYFNDINDDIVSNMLNLADFNYST